ncbi:MAG: sigma-54 interaction domain-containing protein [Methylococcaceae bacterium]
MESERELEILQQACQAKSGDDFVRFFSIALQKKYDLYGVSFFALNDTKDHLLLSASTVDEFMVKQPLAMPVNNTSNPLVYALVTNKPYFMQPSGSLFDAGESFKIMLESFPAELAIECFPISLTDKGTLGVLVCTAPGKALKAMQSQLLQSDFLAVFSSIFGLYKMLEKNDKDKNLLKIDLIQKAANEHKKTIQQHIARRFVGDSVIVQKTWDLLAKAAVSEMAILLRGETGVGKDLAATIIHDYSSRANERLIVVNCAAIPESLLESELFGHCKGAFTGANSDKQGLVAMAHKGTLFLDEIGDLSLMLQAKLLRVLQEKKFTPLGGKKEIHSDFRLISATHRPLETWVKKELFRQDLFYRINQFGITLPTLSERKGDITKIVTLFINEYIKENNVHIVGCSEAALTILKKYQFPGNVRELRNIIYQACLFVETKDKKISKQNIVDRLANMNTTDHADSSELTDEININGHTLVAACEAFEFKVIRTALIETGWSRSKAAIKLGIPKRTLAYKCKKWDINIENV